MRQNRHYRRHVIARRLFRMVSNPTRLNRDDYQTAFEVRSAETHRFLGRFAGHLQYRNAKVLDVGCGLGATCLYLAEAGASRVIGIDVDPARAEFARGQLNGAYRRLAGRVSFQVIEEIEELHDAGFDLIVVQDAFQYVKRPEALVAGLVERLSPTGEVAIGMSPLWNSPRGGLIAHTTWLPWAHRIFPEEVISEERGHTFEDNRVSQEAFQNIMRRSGLDERYLAFNVNSGHLNSTKVLNALRALPIGFIRELGTLSIYGIWKKPLTATSTTPGATEPTESRIPLRR
jgi:SAM-dependent methyltransferase